MKKRLFTPWILPLSILFAALILTSCSEDLDPVDYETHPTGWNNPGSDAFHGSAAMTDKGSGCKSCHGMDFTGINGEGSCYECHGALHLGVEAARPATHRAFIADAAWNLDRCARCHGSTYSGGSSGFSCNHCHNSIGGPSVCGTCHALPPVDADGLPFGMADNAAGAHGVHARFGCTECHPAVANLSHAGALPAEISFAAARFARWNGFNPVYSHLGSSTTGNGSCATVYCHSDGRGNAASIMPQWTAGGISCEACHQLPPPAPHPAQRECHHCHTNVDPASDYRSYLGIRFLVDSIHVNGAVNF